MNEVYQLGDGFNLSEMSQKQGALELSKPERKGIFKSKKDTFYCASIVEDINSSGSSVQLDGGVTVPIHGVDLTAKFGAEANNKRAHHTLYYVVHFYKVEQMNRFESNVFLTKENEALLKNNDSAFNRKFGDSYVGQIAYGRRLTAMIKFETDSEEKKRELSTKLAVGKKDLIEFSAGCELHLFLKKEKIKCEIMFSAEGIDVPLPGLVTDLSDVSKLIEKVNQECESTDKVNHKESKKVHGLAQLYLVRKSYAEAIHSIDYADNMDEITLRTQRYLTIIHEIKERGLQFLSLLNRDEFWEKQEERDEIYRHLKFLDRVESEIRNASVEKVTGVINRDKNVISEAIQYLNGIRDDINLVRKGSYPVSQFSPRKSTGGRTAKLELQAPSEALDSLMFQYQSPGHTIVGLQYMGERESAYLHRKELKDIGEEMGGGCVVVDKPMETLAGRKPYLVVEFDKAHDLSRDKSKIVVYQRIHWDKPEKLVDDLDVSVHRTSGAATSAETAESNAGTRKSAEGGERALLPYFTSRMAQKVGVQPEAVSRTYSLRQ